jgi:site-specific recombinase XerD
MQDFFSSHMRNPNTRRAYREAVRQFSAFCAEHGIVDLAQVQPSMWRHLSRCNSSCAPDLR